MIFTNMIRRAASRAAPLVSRSLRYNPQQQQSVVSGPISSSVPLSQKLFRSSFSSAIDHVPKSKSPTDTLIKVIEYEIVCAEESDKQYKIPEVPESFPFKIIDEPGHHSVTLTREYQGESISVEVHMPGIVTGEENENDDDDDDDTRAGNQLNLPMVVKVAKQDGSCLEFGVTAYPDEVKIESLSIKNLKAGDEQIPYEGPDFGDLDENLQRAFHKYLNVRGISPNTTNSMHEYMIDKDNKEYIGWLKNVKKFIEA